MATHGSGVFSHTGSAAARRFGSCALALVVRASLLLAVADGLIPSLTEADFVHQLQRSTSALVAFVAPWCIACRKLLGELGRVQETLAQRSPGVLVVQCDISRELGLAARYRAWRTPLVLLFPDTRVRAPRLQHAFGGQLLHPNILAFASHAQAAAPPQLRSPGDLALRGEAAAGSAAGGTFVGFFHAPDGDGPLQELWSLDCLARHRRALAFAHGPGEWSGEELWRWAGLAWGEGMVAEEAILFVPSSGADCDARPAARFTGDQAGMAAPWRSQVDAFCAWCEQRVLAPVAIFDAPRAAALDRTFDWLLLLFAPQSMGWDEDEEKVEKQFPLERRRLEQFIATASAGDRRYQELLPVIVPWGAEDITAFQKFLGIGLQEPLVGMSRADDSRTTEVPAPDLADANASVELDPGRKRQDALWAVVLFNTRTRWKYPVPGGAGWHPGDEVSLQEFTDATLNGHVAPYFRSLENFPVAADPPPGAAPDGRSRVAELVGVTFNREAIEPVAAGSAEVLLLLYAPWCSHSLNFFSLWHEFAANVRATEVTNGSRASPNSSAAAGGLEGIGRRLAIPAGRLLLAQMDATQNEHPELPPVDRFPTVLLCKRSVRRSVTAPGGKDPAQGGAGARGPAAGENTTRANYPGARGAGPSDVHFVMYDGGLSLAALRAWVEEHSAFASPALDVESAQAAEL